MTGTIHAVAATVPGYCTSGHGVLTPSEWKTCWNLGSNQPVNGAATAGAAVGHYAAPLIVIIAIVVLLVAAASRRSPATSRS